MRHLLQMPHAGTRHLRCCIPDVLTAQANRPDAIEGAHVHICPQALAQVTRTFQEAVAGVQAHVQPVNEAIVAVLLDRCLTVLRQLRGITATYRMTARYVMSLNTESRESAK